MRRRDFLNLVGAVGISSVVGWRRAGRGAPRSFDAVVVGAGVFGTWIARELHLAGRRVAVVDAVGAAHSAAASGGESRVTRCGYGAEELYAEWACRSITEWRALSQRASLPLFHETGIVWIHREGEEFYEDIARGLSRLDIPFQRLSSDELGARYPVLRVSDDEAGLVERSGGALMARRSVQQLAAELASDGVIFLHGRVAPVRASDAIAGSLPFVSTDDGDRIEAETFVFACGPWLDRTCPEAMAGRLFVTRQEVVFFAVDRDATGDLPVWADLPFYGMPSLEGRGFKVADDTHGPEVDFTQMDRTVGDPTIERAREFLARRFPSLANSPVSETRVCQYENSSNGDFVLDRHPGLDNAWLAGCGSGHGFKHGPAVGVHVAGLVLGTERPIARFSLESKATRQQREIQ